MMDQANSTAWDDNCLVDKNEAQIRKVSSEHTFDRSPRKPLPHSDAYYMRLALQQAGVSAAQANEVPIGAIIVWDDGEIIGMGRNARESEKNALYHAECRAIDMACRSRDGWRLHRAAHCLSRWNLVPCVPAPLSMHAFPVSYLAHRIHTAVQWEVCVAFIQSKDCFIPRSVPMFWEMSAPSSYDPFFQNYVEIYKRKIDWFLI